MYEAKFRFYEELNDFLPERRKRISFEFSFEGNPAVKDIIESFGVPHTEVDLIIVNGVSVAFNYNLKDGDYVSVYPVFENLDISNLTHLREKPLRNPKFICDVQLGRLAKYLRMLGFDTLYNNKYNEKEVIKISNVEKRTVLTRNVFLLKNSLVVRGYWIRSQDPHAQIIQVIHYSDLLSQMKSFYRCSECNGLLEPVSKDIILDRLLPNTKKYFNEFHKCNSCDKIYWKGSHYKKILDLSKNVRKDVEDLFNNNK
ncbi:MAG: twitching motility protein PilT [Ignavibacteriae bacterium]|nr:twitching motility protein PilT [Ignavibacteriota bacterium]